jgi:hypothetical protein
MKISTFFSSICQTVRYFCERAKSNCYVLLKSTMAVRVLNEVGWFFHNICLEPTKIEIKKKFFEGDSGNAMDFF